MSKSGHGKQPLGAFSGSRGLGQLYAFAAFIALALPTRVEAQGPAGGPCRAVLVQPASQELGLRILGQSRDVACGLELVSGGETSCAELGAQHGADAVLRVREPSETGSYEVVVCDVAEASEQTRGVPIEHGTGDTLGASAAYEAVALVVRSALVDIAAARAAREDKRLADQRALAEAQAREAAERAAEQERTRVQDEPQPDEDSELDPEPRLWTLWAGTEFAFIAAKTPALGLVGRITYRLGTIGLGASFSYGFPASLEDDVARIRLQQHALRLSAAITLALSDDVWLDTSVMPGLAVLSRSTAVRTAGASGAGDATLWSAVIGLESGLGVRLLGAFGVRLHIGLDVVPSAPRFIYKEVDPQGRPVSSAELAPANYLQSRAGIMLFYAL